MASWGRGFLPRRGGWGERLATPCAAESWSAADPSGACWERGGPKSWSGAGSRLLQQQGAVGLGALAQLPVSWVPELPLPHSRALGASARASQDPPSKVATRVAEGEWGGEAEPRAVEKRGECGIVCRPLGAGELCGMEGLGGAGEEGRENQQTRGSSPWGS